MGGSHASIKRQTKQNLATLGVSLVVLGPPWRPLSLWVCDMPIQDWDEVRKSKKLVYIRIFLWGRVKYWHQKADKVEYSSFRGISGCCEADMGTLVAMGKQYAPPRLRWGRREQRTALHKDIFKGGSHTSIKRRTMQNAATLGLSLAILGPLWGPPEAKGEQYAHPRLRWGRKEEKLLYIRIFLWKSCILAPKVWKSKTQQP